MRTPMQFISAQQVDQVLEFPLLINALQHGFASEFSMPARQVCPLSATGQRRLCAVASLDRRPDCASKPFVIFRHNAQSDLPSVTFQYFIVPAP
ncbi:MAG: hypothetical protein U5L02_14335 [Rheinheimera sp.]|nr:hypothetical protein [Rheinheimera sp.]